MTRRHQDNTAGAYQDGATRLYLDGNPGRGSILAVGVLAAATMISRSVIQDARAYHITHAALMAEEF